jgi:hypothetical protein
MATLDVFKADGFSVTNLSLAIAEMDFVPSKIENLGLFRNESVTTTTVQVEKRRDTLFLVPSSGRGGSGYAINQDKRALRAFNVPHFQLDDAIQADEVQNIRAFGSESELESVQNRLNQKLQRGARSLDATIEFQRAGVLQGNVYDVRPSGNSGDVGGAVTNNYTVETLYNYYTEFGVTQDTVDFPFSNANLDMVGKCSDIAQLEETELGMMTYQRLHVFCGYDWWKSFISHPKVTDAYKYWMGNKRAAMDPLTMDLRYAGFEFGGITFEVYRGKVGNRDFFPAGEAYCFPIGVPDLFVSHFAPADYIETVNTPGLPRYAKQYETPNGKAIQIEMQTNHLAMCTRPKTIIKLTKS